MLLYTFIFEVQASELMLHGNGIGAFYGRLERLVDHSHCVLAAI